MLLLTAPEQHSQSEATALQAHVDHGIVLDDVPPLSSFLEILRDKQGSGWMSSTRLLCIKVSTYSLNSGDTNMASGSGAELTTTLIWLPSPIVQRVLPRMVQLYNEKKASRQSRLSSKVRTSLHCM